MPSWNQILDKLNSLHDPLKQDIWVKKTIKETFSAISKLRSDRNVIFYSSAYMQKPGINPYVVQINPEDMNGFMTNIHGLTCEKGLTLILHTPGGITNAAETIIDYLHRKFDYIEVIIPTFAMSAGTMISLCSHKIIMGRQSQMGPIDPQLPVNGNRYASALSIRNQFLRAQNEILENKDNAHVWAPILPSLGPALLQEAENAISYGEDLVKQRLMTTMFKGNPDAEKIASTAANYFSQCEKNTSHGRRINRDEARSQGIIIEDLEDDQNLQESVMTLYHLITVLFEKTPAAKIIANSNGNNWVKNVSMPNQMQQIIPQNIRKPGDNQFRKPGFNQQHRRR